MLHNCVFVAASDHMRICRDPQSLRELFEPLMASVAV